MVSAARPTRIWIALLLGLVLQSLGIATLCLLPDVEGVHSVAHPRWPGLHIASPAGVEGPLIPFVAATYGASILLTILALLALGLRGGKALMGSRRSFLAAALVLCGCYGGLWISYFLAHKGPALFGLPAASAWLLFGLWPAEALFALVFMRHFRTSYWSPESEQRFEELLRERAAPSTSPEAQA